MGKQQYSSSRSASSSPPWSYTVPPSPINNRFSQDAIFPCNYCPHSPLPSESTPIGPHDPTTAGPSTVHGPPPHHVPRPHLTEGRADTDDTTAPLAAITLVTPAPPLPTHELILALGLSISPQPITQPAQPATAELLAFFARSPALRAPLDLWHKRLGHPSLEVLNNCIRVEVFILGTLLRPDDSPLTIDNNRFKACEIFKVWHSHAETQSGYTLKIWQTDCAAEFKSNELKAYTKEKGIIHTLSLPYAHPQQGVAECTNRTLMTKVRALLQQSDGDAKYWPYAMHHTVRLHNLLSTTTYTDRLSPYVKARISNLLEFNTWLEK
ncbi:unnamed protein product [Closterium sp. NIES-53]